MPAPWLMARESGLYCRVFVPADLRAHLGQRFLVRSLGSRDRDQARLLAARYALVIGEMFRQLRRELAMPEPKVEDIIKAIKAGGTRDLIRMGKMTLPNGAVIEGLEVDTKDEFESVVKRASAAVPASLVPSWVQNGHGKFRRFEAHGVLASVRQAQYAEYLEKRHTKYQDKAVRVVQMLIDICGDLPPDDYEPDVLDDFVNRIKLLPPHPEKNKEHRDRWAKMNFKQLTNDVEIRGLRCINEETVKDHIAQLASFFSFCKGRRYMGEDSPLAKRIASETLTETKSRRDPFAADDLARIFEPKLYESRKLPHTFWPALIALFTGARCNEIAQLYLDDIVNDDPAHPERWRFMIRIASGRTDQRLKNQFSNRSIPMHPRLIELGFLRYLEDVRSLGFDRVFPSLRWTEAAGYGDTVSDMFSTYLRGKVKIDNRRKVFHSFRHYFCIQAKNFTDEKSDHILDLTGHARKGEFDLTYARELFYENKMRILMKIPMPVIEVPPYAPGGFLRYLRATKEKKASEAAASPEIKDAHHDARTGKAPVREASAKPAAKGFTIKASRPRKPKAPDGKNQGGPAKEGRYQQGRLDASNPKEAVKAAKREPAIRAKKRLPELATHAAKLNGTAKEAAQENGATPAKKPFTIKTTRKRKPQGVNEVILA